MSALHLISLPPRTGHATFHGHFRHYLYSRSSQPVQGTASASAFTPTLGPLPVPSSATAHYESTRTGAQLWPDLLLRQSDFAVQRVGVLLRWFKGVSGTSGL